MQFKPTIKQYIALMKLGAIPLEKVVDWERIPVKDKLGRDVYDSVTEVLGYGGAAGWGKSYLISYWLKNMCERYPGTRWFLARNELKRLKASTLLTFWEVLHDDGYVRDAKWPKGYKYNDVRGWIEFNNGSAIDLIELWYQPSDPLYGRIGSTEYTGGAIDEASEIQFDGFDTINTRVRYKLEHFCHWCAWPITRENFVKVVEIENPEFWTDPEVIYTEDMRFFKKNLYKCPHCERDTYWLTGRIICSFNPDKGWVYSKFYRKFRDGNLPENIAFIPALPGDNPYLPAAYIQRLYSSSEVVKQRLLYGNFDYDDTPGRLFEYNKILEWFEKKTVSEEIEEEFEENPNLERAIEMFGRLPVYGYKYRMVIDPAREGKDLAVFIIANHLSVEKIVVYGKSTMDELEKKAKELMHYYLIEPKDVLVDEWGVGWGLKDRLKCKGFIAHWTAIQPKKGTRKPTQMVSYHRLRDQCYHLLSLKQDEIAISMKDVEIYNSGVTVEQLKRMIIDDTDAIVQVDIDKDAPFRVINKQELKKKIGRSPDIWDTLMMLMFFEIQRPKRVFARG